MTVELWTRAPVYTVAGIGPYAIPHPYTQGAIRAFVVVDGARVALTDISFSLTPTISDATGDLYLTPTAATTHAGRSLIIDRLTADEQGWVGILGDREKGMEAQLDRQTQAIQEVRAEVAGALRTRNPLGPFIWLEGTVPILIDGEPTSGPTATDVAGAQPAAVAAAASAAAAALYGGYRRDDVAALLADTTFAYAAGPGLVVPPVAAIVTTSAEGYAYRCEPVIATGPDMVQTAGGYKLRVLPLNGGVDPIQLGAAVDFASGVDDTPFYQACLAMWAVDRNLHIKLTRKYNIAGTVLIENLETDDPETRLEIVGPGTLYKGNAGFIHDKVPGQGIDPPGPDPFLDLQTGHIFFHGVRFEGANLLGETFILQGDNIIRAHFRGCFGTKINIAKADAYLQTITVDEATTWRKWRGYLFDCDYLFDVRLLGVFEAGDGVLITRDAAADPACNSLTISGNIEGNSGVSGPAIKVGVCFGVVVDGLYMEANAGGDLDFSGGTGFHKGLTITGVGVQPNTAQLADANYYPIKVGKGAVDAITLTGNASTHNLFDVAAANQSAIFATGNYVPPGKVMFKSGSPRVVRSQGIDLKGTLVDSVAGWGLNMAYSSFGVEGTRETVAGESLLASLTMGPTNPALGGYVQTNWVKGTFVFNSSPGIVVRQYGVGITRDALLLGWVCEASGTPGTWREVPIMLPF